MAEITNELMDEVLKQLQPDMAALKEGQRRPTQRSTRFECTWWGCSRTVRISTRL